MRFEVPILINVKNTVFWDTPLGSLVVTRHTICKLNHLHRMHTTGNFCIIEYNLSSPVILLKDCRF